jgi:hypothetical protein
MVPVVLSNATDADLFDRQSVVNNLFRAATVEMQILDTASNRPQSSLFSISDLVPYGFQVASIRVANTGDLSMRVRFSIENISGEPALCNTLGLRVMESWETTYLGDLNALQLETDILTETYHDLVLAVSLNDETQNLALKNCSFTLVAETIQEVEGGVIKLSDTRRVANQVNTAQWVTSM